MYPRNKYRNHKVTVDGITFDSKKEAARWGELQKRQERGEISQLDRQVKYELIPVQRSKKTGKVLERACYYVADFVYWENGFLVVEDTKGMKTEKYIIKRKLMLYKHGIQIQEV